MSRTESDTSDHRLSTSDVAASLQGGRLSEDTAEKSPIPRTANVNQETSSDASVLWVDWDGPNDPMNPKKWAVRPYCLIDT